MHSTGPQEYLDLAKYGLGNVLKAQCNVPTNATML
jgi:hypothetical protein